MYKFLTYWYQIWKVYQLRMKLIQCTGMLRLPCNHLFSIELYSCWLEPTIEKSFSTIWIYFERFLKVKKCKKRKFRQKCNFFYISWTSMQKFYEGLKSSFLDWTSNISADDQGYWSPYVSFFQLSIPDSREHVWLVLYDRENTNMNKICNWGML